MKWQAIITKKQCIKSVFAVLFSPIEALLFAVVLVAILVLQQFSDGLVRMILLAELGLVVGSSINATVVAAACYIVGRSH